MVPQINLYFVRIYNDKVQKRRGPYHINFNKQISCKVHEYDYFYFECSNNSKIIPENGINECYHNDNTIFKYHGHICYYALTSKAYKIYVRNGNGEGSFNIEVLPRPFDTKSLNHIIDVLCKFDLGLAIKDINCIDKRFGINNHIKNVSKNVKYLNVANSSTLLIKRFQSLLMYPVFSISRAYIRSNTGKADSYSNRLNEERPHLERKYHYINYCYYNNNKNRLIKHILVNLIELSYSGIHYFRSKGLMLKHKLDYYNLNRNEFNRRKRDVISYEDTIKRLEKLYDFLNKYNQVTFFHHVDLDIKFYKINDLLSYPRYYSIYKKYHDIYEEEQELNHIYLNLIGNKHVFLMAPTFHLYELWTLIYIIKVVKCLGFKFKKQINTLHEGSVFTCHKNDLVLRIIYNQFIDGNNDINLKITGHNKPDIRIDIFNKNNKINSYIGSLILDAKCKSLKNVLKEDVEKLSSYIEPVSFNNKGYNPIIAVVALFPGYNDGLTKDADVEYKLKLISKGIKPLKMMPYLDNDLRSSEEFKRVKSFIKCLINNTRIG